MHTKPLNRTLALAVVLIGLLSYNFIGAQWTPPGGAPPAGNVAAPLDTSVTSQVKTGALGTGPLSVTGNALLTSGAPSLELDDTDGRKFWLHNNSGFLYVLANRDGNKGTAEPPYPLTLVTNDNYLNDYALFSGKVLASEYCDRNGGNCSTAAQLKASTNIASNSTYTATNQVTGLIAGQKYLVFFYGPGWNSSGGRIEDCANNVLVSTPVTSTTDRNVKESHLLSVTVPASGCIRAFTQGVMRTAAQYITVL